jgi:hypothetical protein
MKIKIKLFVFLLWLLATSEMLLLSAFQCPGVCVIKHFTVVTNGQLGLLNLIFARKLGAYPSGAPLGFNY